MLNLGHALMNDPKFFMAFVMVLALFIFGFVAALAVWKSRP